MMLSIHPSLGALVEAVVSLVVVVALVVVAFVVVVVVWPGGGAVGFSVGFVVSLVVGLGWVTNCIFGLVAWVVVGLVVGFVVGARVTFTTSWTSPQFKTATSAGSDSVGAGSIGFHRDPRIIPRIDGSREEPIVRWSLDWNSPSFGSLLRIFEIRSSSARSFSSGKFSSLISRHVKWWGRTLTFDKWANDGFDSRTYKNP